MGDDYQRQVYQLNQMPENQVRAALRNARPAASSDSYGAASAWRLSSSVSRSPAYLTGEGAGPSFIVARETRR